MKPSPNVTHADVITAVRTTLVKACDRAASPGDVGVIAQLLVAYTNANDWIEPVTREGEPGA